MRGNTESERWALDRRRQFDAHVAALVREAVDAGEIRAGVEPALAARLLSFGELGGRVGTPGGARRISPTP